MKQILSIAFVICLCCGSATAAEELNYHLVNLQAEVFRHVDNDQLVVILSAVAEGNTAREAARSVNEKMAWAGQMIEAEKDVTYQTMNYQTNPLYQNRTIVGWTVSQQIRLESLQIERLTGLVGTLQDQLIVAAMQFEVSPEQRTATKQHLIAEALRSFTEKAHLITTTLGAKDFRLVTISVNEDDTVPRQRTYAMNTSAMVSAAPAPEIAAGESRLAVTVDGTIQLSF